MNLKNLIRKTVDAVAVGSGAVLGVMVYLVMLVAMMMHGIPRAASAPFVSICENIWNVLKTHYPIHPLPFLFAQNQGP